MANTGNLDATIEQLLNVEKQMRVAGDVAGTKKPVSDILQLCFEERAWKTLNDHGQFEQLDQLELTLPRGSTADAAKANLDKLQRNLFSFRFRTGSQFAPLFADNKPDSNEKLRQMRPSLSRKFSSYVLPTPVDAKSSISSRSNNLKPSKMQVSTANNLSFFC